MQRRRDRIALAQNVIPQAWGSQVQAAMTVVHGIWRSGSARREDREMNMDK
jgi:hypothetical protein